MRGEQPWERGHSKLSLDHWWCDPEVQTSASGTTIAIWEELATEDRYFHDDEPDTSSLGLVMDRMLERLPADQRDCLHLVIVSGLSMRKAAEVLGWILPSGQPDGKKVSRNLRYGQDQMREWLTRESWMRELLKGYLPPVEGDE